jgi:hypothetical protein
MMHQKGSTNPPAKVYQFPIRKPAAQEPKTTRARAKRELLTREQYAAARALARVLTGGFSVFDKCGSFAGRYYQAIRPEERSRLRGHLLDLAGRLDINAESFTYRASERRRARRWQQAPEEWAAWPRMLFVACIKLLNQRRREGRPDEAAERLACSLVADAERHEEASRAYKPAPANERPAPAAKPDAYARAARMKARRAGHPAPPARREPGGQYREFECEGGGLAEYGYPGRIVFLVRTDVEPQPGQLVLIEREPFMYGGHVNQFDSKDDRLRIGLLGHDERGELRLESLTCGPYGYRIKRVVGVIVGPVADAQAESTPAPNATDAILRRFLETSTDAEESALIRRLLEGKGNRQDSAEEWPEYINTEGGAA